MMRLTTKVLALISLLNVIVQAAVKVSQTTEGGHDTVSVGASMQFPAGESSAPTSKPRKPHRRSKRTTRDSAAIQKSVSQAGGSDPRAGVPDVKKTTPGNIDVLKGNDAGRSNMQSPDHVPGTTGTSGQ